MTGLQNPSKYDFKACRTADGFSSENLEKLEKDLGDPSAVKPTEPEDPNREIT
jgi:hypothetical protein